MIPLRQACDEYLALRRALGFKLKRHGRLLPDLVAHLDATGVTTVTTRLALEWATQPAGHPQEWAVRLSIARGFARYLRSLDGRAEVPPADLLPRCRRRPAPHLYTDQEIAALLAATETLRFPLGRATYRTLLGLLVVSGIRIGEAIWLDRSDVDFESGGVIVRGGKPGAPRELPLHPSALQALEQYAQVRDRHWPSRSRRRSFSPRPAPGCSTRTSTKPSAAWSPKRALDRSRTAADRGFTTRATRLRSGRSPTSTAQAATCRR